MALELLVLTDLTHLRKREGCHEVGYLIVLGLEVTVAVLAKSDGLRDVGVELGQHVVLRCLSRIAIGFILEALDFFEMDHAFDLVACDFELELILLIDLASHIVHLSVDILGNVLIAKR